MLDCKQTLNHVGKFLLQIHDQKDLSAALLQTAEQILDSIWNSGKPIGIAF